jgi:hypothetical protein
MLAIRDEYVVFIAEIMNGATDIQEKRDGLKAKLDICYQFSPQQVD